MARITRRKFLKVSGSGVAAAKAAGIAGILAAGTAPAYAQGATVHWLRWNDFVPASDQLLRKEMLPEAEKALGVKITFETVNANDLQPRITSAIQSGAGPDLIMLNNNHPQLYAASCVDMSDLVDALAKVEGAHYPLVKANSNDGKKWISDAVGHHRRHDRLPQIMVRRGGRDVRSPTLGSSIARSVPSSRPRAGQSARRWDTPLATLRRSPIPICGHGAARRSRPMARRWSSTARRRSNPSSS